MKRKCTVNVKTLYFCGWILILLINDKFFQLCRIPDSLYIWMGSTSRALVGTLCIIFGMLALVWSNKKFRNSEGRFLKLYLGIYTLAIVAIAAYTVLVYDLQPAKVSYKYAAEYLIVLETFALCGCMVNEENTERVFEVVNIFSFLHNVLIIGQQILYSINRTVFMPDVNVDLYRSGVMRISMGTFGNFFILYNFYCLFFDSGKKKKIKYILYLVTGLYALVVVQQTRMYIVSILIVAVVIILIESKSVRKCITGIVLFCTGIVVLAGTGYLQKLLQSFSSTDDAFTVSRNNRFYAFSYYWHLFLKHPLLGMGFARNDVYKSIVHGPLGIADITDVGFVGQLATLGVCAFIIYIPFLFYLFKTAIKTGNRIVLMGALYCLLTSVTLIALNAPNIVLVPFLLAYAFYENRKSEAKMEYVLQ
ncbi:MAG: O-antigen ligase family protein [Eubacterium sp.]